MEIQLTTLQLSTAVLAVEAYLETLVDQRHHAEDRAAVEARGEDTSEYDELDVCIDEASALLALLRGYEAA